MDHFENLTVSEIQKELVRLGLEWRHGQVQHKQNRSKHQPSPEAVVHKIGNVSTISSMQLQNFKELESKNTSTLELFSTLERVPGCVANVEIFTALRVLQRTQQSQQSQSTLTLGSSYSSDTFDNKVSYVIGLGGHADAILSQGLLVVLANYVAKRQQLQLQSSSADNILLAISPQQVADDLYLRHALSSGRNDGLANMMRLFQDQLRSLLLELPEQNQSPKQQQEVQLQNRTMRETRIKPNIMPRRLRTLVTIWRRITTFPLTQSIVAKSRRILLLFGSKGSTDKRAPTVAVLLSGGVDSSVALALLRRKNYDCTAFYLKIWLEDELAHLGVCPWEDDYRTCQQVCQQLNVPLESISLQREYKEKVMTYTLAEAQKGRTPNPDIMCNARVKFGCFYDAIANRGFDYVASGHYAQVKDDLRSSGRNILETGTPRRQRLLLRAPDPIKDQSYFLCSLSQDQLQRVLFPIGHLQKSDVRQLAHDFGLPNRNRPDSQGLCFLGKVKFEDFLQAYLGEEPGDILDAATGEIIGRHRGVWYHTVGQRKGLGKVLNPFCTSRGPWYVVAKDPRRHLLYCSNEYDEEMFTGARSEFHVEDLHWISGTPPPALQTGAARLQIKIRHGPRLVQGKLELDPEDKGNEGRRVTGKVRLDNKDGGLAPGQFVAFYQDLECLGGGVISEHHWAEFLAKQRSAASQLASP
jgi:tRNA-specific 2-thiouridylase